MAWSCPDCEANGNSKTRDCCDTCVEALFAETF